jgi:muconolactone delta-isomerase
VAKIVRLLGLTPDEARIGKSIADNTVERMRAKEKETPQRASKRGRFIRSGSVGGWRANLSPEQVQLFEQYAGDALARAGYPLSADAPEPVTA